MVAPGSLGTEFDVFLAFTLDEAANKRVQQRISTIQDELKRIQEQAKKSGKAMNEMADTSAKKTDSAQKSVASLGAEVAKLGESAKSTSKKVDDGLSGNIRKYKQLEEAAKKAKTQAALVSGAAARAGGIFGQGLVLGGAITGGIIAEANRFAKEAENAGKATQATREWTRATRELASARAQVDNVLLKEALPLLKQAARVATQASHFIEKHPEIVRATLNAGVLIAGLSAVGLAVSKGIKLVADVRYIAAVATEMVAARLQDAAANKQLAAAAAQNKSTLGNVPKVGGAVGGAVGITALLIANVALSNKLSGQLDQVKGLLNELKPGSGGIVRSIASALITALPGGQIFGAVDSIKTIESTLSNFFDQYKSSAGTGSIGGRSVTTSSGVNRVSLDTQRSIVDAWQSWREEDAKLVREAATNRTRIIEDAERRIADITRNYTDQRVAINKRFSDQRSSIIEDYAQDLQKSEQDYARNRADIIKDAGEDIQRIEEQHQENIRKMTLDHNQRVEDLTASRDALGLVKEERRFNQDLSESERGVNREIAQRRQETARRLVELAEEFALERAQRQQQFQQALADNERRRQEELKQAEIAHQEELKRVREARAQQLRELQETLNAERIRRRELFIAQIRDLDATLLGERNLKLQYYQLMLQDANTWLAQYRAALASGASTGTVGANTPGRASGGYAYPGLYQLGEEGKREYVLSGSTTKAAEKIIGGQLSQANLLGALNGLGSTNNVSYTDQRRIERPMSKDEKNLQKQVALDTLNELMAGA